VQKPSGPIRGRRGAGQRLRAPSRLCKVALSFTCSNDAYHDCQKRYLEHHHHDPKMTSQIRKSKRSYSAIDSDDQSPTRSSQRKRRPTTKVVQVHSDPRLVLCAKVNSVKSLQDQSHHNKNNPQHRSRRHESHHHERYRLHQCCQYVNRDSVTQFNNSVWSLLNHCFLNRTIDSVRFSRFSGPEPILGVYFSTTPHVSERRVACGPRLQALRASLQIR
jgi:hypothetical protein